VRRVAAVGIGITRDTAGEANRARGVAPDWRSGMTACKHRDVPWELEASAREALEREPGAPMAALPVDAA
jgi:hypothetical protein